MSHRYILLLAALLVAAVVSLIAFQTKKHAPHTEAIQSPSPPIESSTKSNHTDARPEQSAILLTAIGPTSALQTQFSSSFDLRAFVDDVLPKADRGDPESQYFAFKALGECWMFAWARSRTSKDAWLTAMSSTSVEEREKTARSFDRCEQFIGLSDSALIGYYGDDHYSKMRQWLKLSAEGGHGVAQASQAAEDITLPGADAATRTKALEMLSAAALTREPDALTTIAMLYAGADTTEQVAWLLVACSSGQDCGPGSAVREQLCALPRSCTRSESVAEIMLANLGDVGLAQAKERANVISDAIGKRATGSLGLEKILATIPE